MRNCRQAAHGRTVNYIYDINTALCDLLGPLAAVWVSNRNLYLRGNLKQLIPFPDVASCIAYHLSKDVAMSFSVKSLYISRPQFSSTLSRFQSSSFFPNISKSLQIVCFYPLLIPTLWLPLIIALYQEKRITAPPPPNFLYIVHFLCF